MDRDEIRRRYQVTHDEAYTLEKAIIAIRDREERKQVLMAEAEGYRALSNFVLNPQHPDVRDAPPSPEVVAFLAKSEQAEWDNDRNQGMTYSPPARDMLTIDAVREYLSAFGWSGLGSRQIAAAIGRDKRGVDRALTEMVEACECTVREKNTRGKSASRKKVYFALDIRPLVSRQAEADPVGGDTYFEDTDDAHDASEHGAGGGRVVRPRGGSE